MSPEHTKAFRDALVTSLEQWEAQFGEIPTPIATSTAAPNATSIERKEVIMTEQYFAGVGTPPPQFSQPSGTQREPIARISQPEPEQRGLVEWLASPEARQLEGRWVLLSDDYRVVDVADSPSALMDRHPDERTPIIVFVRPSNVTYVV